MQLKFNENPEKVKPKFLPLSFFGATELAEQKNVTGTKSGERKLRLKCVCACVLVRASVWVCVHVSVSV